MSSKSFDLTVRKYSDYSVVVRGDTRTYKEDLKKLGGKYNGSLKDDKGGKEPGWIFPKKVEKDLVAFITSGKRLVTDDEAAAGEERTKHWERQRADDSPQEGGGYKKEWQPNQPVPFTPTLGEFAQMANLINILTARVEILETALVTNNLTMLNDERDKRKKTNEAVERKKERDAQKKLGITSAPVKKKIVKRKSDSDDSDIEVESASEEEEEYVPRRRLMR